MVALLYGGSYEAAAPVLKILVWSAALVLLRGTFRQALCAAGEQRADLGCAASCAGINVALNLLLIPRFGLMGAAVATLLSEVVWVASVVTVFSRRVGRLALVSALVRPVGAGLVMTVCLLLLPGPWFTQALVAGAVYLLALFALGERLQ